MNIKGLNKGRVLKALYEGSSVVGMGVFSARHDPIPASDFETAAEAGYIDYLWGKPIKVRLTSDEIDLRLYDRDAGQGAGEAAILREFTDPAKASQ